MEVREFLEKSASGGVNLEEAISNSVKRAKEIQKKYSPFITINENPKIESRTGPMLGLAVSVKDCICTNGIRTTAGSKILENYIPPFDATVVERIKKAGAYVLGKTVQDEFGFGTFCTNSAYSIPKNPYDVQRSCGGSSGGSGCITAAADFPHISIAESTGGSITAPAAFTGTIGLTPTYGRVSRWGLIDYANSLDKIGVMGKDVFSVALALSVISGHDPKDSTSNKEGPIKYSGKTGVKGLKIGVPKEYFGEGVDEKISALVWKRIKELESEGAKYEEISLPLTKYAIPSYYIIAVSEASTNLSKYCGLRYGAAGELDGNFEEYFSKVRSANFGEEAKRRIILGSYARMAGFRDAYYLKALKVRAMMVQEYKSAFAKYDLIATPSMPILPLRFDEISKLTPVQNYMMDVMTVAPNLAGVPMLSMPAGLINGLPAGIHFVANHMKEEKLLNVAEFAEGLKWK
jgi:aspartyl-tRNA(Asn)/glutamyl-tRNA(Gln) amidotransferase subunit A